MLRFQRNTLIGFSEDKKKAPVHCTGALALPENQNQHKEEPAKTTERCKRAEQNYKSVSLLHSKKD